MVRRRQLLPRPQKRRLGQRGLAQRDVVDVAHAGQRGHLVAEVDAVAHAAAGFHAAGRDAFRLAKSANSAMERQKFSEALAILNETVAKYPGFAEGWNRRAVLYWQTGQYEQSVADCKKAVTLNPSHFGAWQGLGLCQLHLGDVELACQSFRAALKINPHDRGLRVLLRQSEELLRKVSPERFGTVDWV